MTHNYTLSGYAYRLRPIALEDAQFIVDVRREDMERNQYIHAISDSKEAQEVWLEKYFQRLGDYYFVIENRYTGDREGLIAFYDELDGRAEWGRWVVRKGSLAAAESVYLLYRIAFEQAGLRELYCHTVADNIAVVSFHRSIGEKTGKTLPRLFEINGVKYDAVEQYSDQKNFYENIAPKLERQAHMIARRILRQQMPLLRFHHIGVATRNIEKELPIYTLLGYEKEGDFFVDERQGIRGLFLVAEGHPRLELLENLSGHNTLDPILARGQKLYHTAYYVKDIEAAVMLLKRNRVKLISPITSSTYFKADICFMYLPNMEMIELLQED